MIFLPVIISISLASELPQSKENIRTEKATWSNLKNDSYSPFNSCISEICEGHEITNLTLDVSDENIKKSEDYEKQFSDLYKKTYDARMNSIKESIEIFEKDQVPEEARLPMQASHIAKLFTDQRGADYVKFAKDKNGNFSLEVDEEGIRSSDLSNDLKKYYLEVGKTIVATKSLHVYTMAGGGLSPAIAFRLKSKTEDYQTHIRNEVHLVLAKIKELEKKYSADEISAMGIKKSLFKNVLGQDRNQYMSEEFVKNLLKESTRAQLIANILSSEKIGRHFKEMNQKDKDSLLYPGGKISLVSNLKQKVDNSKEMSSQDGAVVRNCKENFALNREKLPTEDQIVNAKKSFTVAKAKFIEKMRDYFSPQTSIHLQEYLRSNETDLIFPNTKEQFVSDANRYIQEKTSNLKSGKTTPIASLLNYATLGNTLPLNMDMYDYCNSLKYSLVRDYTTDLGGIVVSSEAVVNPEFGKRVLAHELGHRVFDFMNGDKVSKESLGHFKKIKKCLADLHVNERKERKVYHSEIVNPGFKSAYAATFKEEYHLNEDFADLLSAVVFPEKNAACGFMSIGGKNSEKLFNLDIDSHSDPVHRLLLIERVRKSKVLPETCDKAVSSNGKIEKINACLNPK